MNPILDKAQLVISWLFNFVGMAWMWSIGRIDHLVRVPFADLMVWQVGFLLVITVALFIGLYTFFHHVRGAIFALWSLVTKLVYVLIGLTFLVLALGVWSHVALYALSFK